MKGQISKRFFFILKFCSAFYVFQNYVAEASVCVGPSMEPTLHSTGDVVVFEHLTPRFGSLQVGDVVVAKAPSNPHSYVCKRIKVVGAEPFSSRFWKNRKMFSAYVPRGYVWLEGDNAENSTDSREYGPVPEALIVGRVIFRVWPLNSMGRISRIA
eukprot:jgi/Galph1/5490/GphlegSOOS_G4133.1